MYRRILVALNGSKQAESVLGRAAVLASKNNAEVVLMMVLPAPMMVVENNKVVATIDQEAERMQSAVHPYLQNWRERFEEGGIKTSMAVSFGDPAKQIADYSKRNDVDLIVMARKTRKGLDGLLRRSVADKVMRSVVTPVLLMNAA